MNFTESMTAIFEQLQKFFRTETVVGQPLQVGEITLIPVISVTFGAGNGVGSGKDQKGNDGEGGGGGAGGKITPTAIIVVKKNDVSVLPLSGRGAMDRIVEMVPDIISKVGGQPKDQ